MPTSERAKRAAEKQADFLVKRSQEHEATATLVLPNEWVEGMAAIIDAEFPAGDRRKGERREGSSSGADKDYCLADGSYRRKSERRLDHQLSPSPCGVKGHCKVDWTDWTERRAGERRVVAHICTPYSDCAKLHPGWIGMQRIHANRRITNLGPPCARCEEVRKARDEERKHVDTVVMQRIEILTSCVAELEGRLAKAVTDALEAAVVRFEFVALEYCERWKVMPKEFIDKGTAAIRKEGKTR